MYKNKYWEYIKYSVDLLDNKVIANINKLFSSICSTTKTSGYLNKFIIFDKLQLVLFVTWLWVYIGLLLTKFLEYILKLLLKLPDALLNIPLATIENTNGHDINIISASDGTDDITNKLKMLLRIYWQKGGDDQASDFNGVDCQKIFDLLKCTYIYMRYLIENKKESIHIEKSNNSYYRYSKEDKSDYKKIFMRHLTLD